MDDVFLLKETNGNLIDLQRQTFGKWIGMSLISSLQLIFNRQYFGYSNVC